MEKGCATMARLFYGSIFLIFLIVSLPLTAQMQETYSRARVNVTNGDLSELVMLGVCVDDDYYRKGLYFESDFSATDIAIMRGAGYQVEILIADVQQYYIERSLGDAALKTGAVNNNSCPTTGIYSHGVPMDFGFGSMGGFYTYQEMLDNLDSMAHKYPNLISARMPIDTFLTFEGRPIYWQKMTSPVNQLHNKPQVLYTALHHAREPASMAQLLYFMYYMLENYGTDPEVTYLLDNAEMVFVPCVNPDGYLENETTFPNGGGMWRKNKRDNGNDNFGVDLNRNYGFKWGISNSGSSSYAGSETYRGPSAFSEPETQAISYLCLQNNFKVALNYHAAGNLLIYPWGYDPDVANPDIEIFKQLSVWMTKDNKYRYGTGMQTVGYNSNGSSEDWMYGEQVLKGKIFSFTPEVGDRYEGFWPAPSSIYPICARNMHLNLTAARVLLNYGMAEDMAPSILADKYGVIKVSVTHASLDTAGGLLVELLPLTDNIATFSAAQTVTGLASFESDTLSFGYSLREDAKKGEIVRYLLTVSNGHITIGDTIEKILGPSEVLFSDSADNTDNWTGGEWDIVPSKFTSAPYSFTDSRQGDYSMFADNSFVLDSTLDLTDAIVARVSFNAFWEIDTDKDFVVLQVREKGYGDAYWNALCGRYTRIGRQILGREMPLYDGFSNGWVQEEIDLSDYLGKEIELRFNLMSDVYDEYDGFYFDDFKVETITKDTADMESTTLLFSELHCYPNPARNEILFSFPSAAANDRIVMYNMIGTKVQSIVLEEDVDTVKASIVDLSSGVYWVQYEYANGSKGVGKKIVVEN